MKKGLILLVLLPLFAANSLAQKQSRMSQSVTAFSDSLARMSASYFAGITQWDDFTAQIPDRIPNPYLYKLIAPPTYYEGVVEQFFKLSTTPLDYEKTLRKKTTMFQTEGEQYTTEFDRIPCLEDPIKIDQWVNTILLDVYVNNPTLIKGNELSYKDLKALEDGHIAKIPKKTKVTGFLKSELDVPILDSESELVVIKPNFWSYSGNGYVNYSQNFISKNWHKGGESTNSLLSGLTLQANYNDREKVQIENKLEMKLGFITAPSDTMHTHKTNDDLFRLSSKIGIRARKHFYYTLGTELRTQFFGSFKTNTNEMISNFLSPMQIDVTLGLDYKRSAKKYSLSLLCSPLAYTFVYIKDADKIINTTTFNVEKGHRTANLFGSKVAFNSKWTIIPSIVWESKLEYFTTYENVIVNWENNINFVLNRYLSTKLFVHARYDDGVTLDDTNKSYFQLQELLSFGINYTW
ncbi:MAG: DUF3078 domain-containing protein [Phocaeicola sp.]